MLYCRPSRSSHAATLHSIRSGLFVGSVLWLASCAAPPREDASAVLARASQAMGAAQLNTLRYSAEGTGTTFGQAYHADAVWPKITVHSLTRSIDYGTGAMRDEVVMSRAEPLGGGGYPLSGQQRNDQFVSGELAWNGRARPSAAPQAGPSASIALDRRTALSGATQRVSARGDGGATRSRSGCRGRSARQ